MTNGELKRELSGFQETCNKRKLSLTDEVEKFKTNAGEMKEDVVKAFEGAKKLGDILEKAQN